MHPIGQTLAAVSIFSGMRLCTDRIDEKILEKERVSQLGLEYFNIPFFSYLSHTRYYSPSLHQNTSPN